MITSTGEYLKSLGIVKFIYNGKSYETAEDISTFISMFRRERHNYVYRIDVYAEFKQYDRPKFKDAVVEVINDIFESDVLIFKENSIIVDGDFRHKLSFKIKLCDNAVIRYGIFRDISVNNKALIYDGLFVSDGTVICGKDDKQSGVRIYGGTFDGIVKIYNGAIIDGGVFKNEVFCYNNSKIINGVFYKPIHYDETIDNIDEDTLFFLSTTKRYNAWRRMVFKDESFITPKKI
jgi:hypothetical protein